jgi:hypothetical protein
MPGSAGPGSAVPGSAVPGSVVPGSAMRANAEGLRRLAAALRLEADHVRLLAVRVRLLGAVRWRSPAAELFRARVEARARGLEASAEEARDLAACLERLAHDLEQASAAVAGLAPPGPGTRSARGAAHRGA